MNNIFFQDNFDGNQIKPDWIVNRDNNSVGSYSTSIVNNKLQLKQIDSWSGSYVDVNIGKLTNISISIDVKLIGTNFAVSNATIRPTIALLKLDAGRAPAIASQNCYSESLSKGIFFNIITANNIEIASHSYGKHSREIYRTYKQIGIFNTTSLTISTNIKFEIVEKQLYVYINNQLKGTYKITDDIIEYFGKDDVYLELYIGNYRSNQIIEFDNLVVINDARKYVIKFDDNLYTIIGDQLSLLGSDINNISINNHGFDNLNSLNKILEVLDNNFILYTEG